MPSTTFTHLITSPSRLCLSTPQPAPDNPVKDTISVPKKSFPISDLPYEIRQLIYTFYFASLPTQNITCINGRLPLHTLTPLCLASPFLASDPAPSLFYKHTEFSFSCPTGLKTFAECISDMKQDIRRAKIMYGRYDQPTRDWVYLLTSNFEELEEMTFAVDKDSGGLGMGHMCFGNWWGCVRDAVREGLHPDSRDREKRRVVLRVEDGEWGIEEVICG
jgi:hypothetical protein